MENVTKSKLSTMKKDDVAELALEQVKVLEEKELELAEKEKAMQQMKEDFQKQLDDMKLMMMATMQGNIANSSKREEEPTVTVACYLLGKNHISLDKENTIKFDYCGAEEVLTHAEAKAMIKFGRNKRLFTEGLLAFTEKEDYEIFKVKPRQILTDDYIRATYQKPIDEFLTELDAITNNKTSDASMHSFIYRSAYLYRKGKLGNVMYPIMEAFKDYFTKSITDIYIDDDIL